MLEKFLVSEKEWSGIDFEKIKKCIDIHKKLLN